MLLSAWVGSCRESGHPARSYLPAPIPISQGKHRKGVLTVTVPKPAPAQTKKIEVKATAIGGRQRALRD